MKPKKFEKKLTLNKETISNLENREMSDVFAGEHTETMDICCTLKTLCQDTDCVVTTDPSIVPHACCH